MIEGVHFFGLGYNHSETLIPYHVDVLVTHEPPMMILDEGMGEHMGNALLRNRVFEVKPRYHLFGHAHSSYGKMECGGIMFYNGALLDDYYNLCRTPHVIEI